MMMANKIRGFVWYLLLTGKGAPLYMSYKKASCLVIALRVVRFRGFNNRLNSLDSALSSGKCEKKHKKIFRQWLE
jgi:hypothetical protein